MVVLEIELLGVHEPPNFGRYLADLVVAQEEVLELMSELGPRDLQSGLEVESRATPWTRAKDDAHLGESEHIDREILQRRLLYPQHGEVAQ